MFMLPVFSLACACPCGYVLIKTSLKKRLFIVERAVKQKQPRIVSIPGRQSLKPWHVTRRAEPVNCTQGSR